MAIRVFGADWCPLTTAAKRHLDRLGVQYQYVDIERDPEAAKWVRSQNEARKRNRRWTSMAWFFPSRQTPRSIAY